jgi:hypothetical protein
MYLYTLKEESDDDKDWFYQILERAHDSVSNNDIKRVIGDLNAKLRCEDINKGLLESIPYICWCYLSHS